MPGRLEGKVIIVTGAGAGFGRGICTKLATEGARLLCLDINSAGADETAKSLPNGPHHVFSGDVTLLQTWTDALRETLDKFGELHGLVNCAGVVHLAGPSHECEEDEYERVMRINVKPLFWSAKAIIGGYWKKEGKKGCVVNISSISEPRPRPFVVWYAGSKGAVTAITRGLAAEYGPIGVRINCIRPVVGETAMLARVLGGSDTEEGRKRLLAAIPLGRVCLPEDVANSESFFSSEQVWDRRGIFHYALIFERTLIPFSTYTDTFSNRATVVSYLQSEEASFITGACMDVDGGRSLQ